MNRHEPGLTTLLRQLGLETTTLIRSEIALAKLEAHEVARTAAIEGARVGAAVALVAVGALALVAWLILAIGHLLGNHYATAAAIAGILLVGTGALLARRAMRTLKSGALKPADTIAELQQDKRWASQQLSEFRSEISRGEVQGADRQ
jgi:hypothetical protein